MLMDAANHLNNFRYQQLCRTCNKIKVSHRNLLCFRFISIILSSDDGDLNRYDGDRPSTSTGNILILEKAFALIIPMPILDYTFLYAAILC